MHNKFVERIIHYWCAVIAQWTFRETPAFATCLGSNSFSFIVSWLNLVSWYQQLGISGVYISVIRIYDTINCGQIHNKPYFHLSYFKLFTGIMKYVFDIIEWFTDIKSSIFIWWIRFIYWYNYTDLAICWICFNSVMKWLNDILTYLVVSFHRCFKVKTSYHVGPTQRIMIHSLSSPDGISTNVLEPILINKLWLETESKRWFDHRASTYFMRGRKCGWRRGGARHYWSSDLQTGNSF